MEDQKWNLAYRVYGVYTIPTYTYTVSVLRTIMKANYYYTNNKRRRGESARNTRVDATGGNDWRPKREKEE